MKIFLIVPFLLFFGCAQNSGSKKIMYEEGQTIKGFKRIVLPLLIDSEFIQSVDTTQKLMYNEIKAFNATPPVNQEEFLDDLTEWNFRELYEIDSLRQIGQYADYLRSLQEGYPKDCYAFKIGYIDIDDNNRVFLWGYKTVSFGKKPQYATTKIMGIYCNSFHEGIHLMLAKDGFFKELPYTSNKYLTTANFADNGTCEITSRNIYNNLDRPSQRIIRSSVKIKSVRMNAIYVTKFMKEFDDIK